MSIKEHARRLSTKMKDAMKKGEKDLGDRHPDHKIFEVKFHSISTSIIGLLIVILIASFLTTFLESSYKVEEVKDIYLRYHTASIICIAFLVYSLPGKDEFYPFSYVAKPFSIFFCLLQLLICGIFSFLAFTSVPSIYPILPICSAITALSIVLLTYFGTHYRIFTYDPFRHNKNYKLARRVDKSAGHLEILSSRPFQITVKNIGLESWKSQTGYMIKRQVTVNRRRTGTLIPIPKNLVIPSNQKLTLIPETEMDIKETVKIPHFRCFGFDVGNTVLTSIVHRNPNIKKKLASLEEQFVDLTAPTEWNRVTEMVNATNGPQTIEII